MGNTQLEEAQESENSNSITLMEDIDCSVASRSRSIKQDPNSQNYLALAGLLESLDGFMGLGDGKIIIITTNNPELLDEALTRPGRIDAKFEFPPHPVQAVTQQMFNH